MIHPEYRSLADLYRQQATEGLDDSDYQVTDLAEPTAEAPDSQGGYQMVLRQKRRAAMLKQMLSDAGYEDLMKMVNLRERE